MFKGKEVKRLARKLMVLLDDFEAAKDAEDRKKVYVALEELFEDVWGNLGGLEKKVIFGKIRNGLRKMI